MKKILPVLLALILLLTMPVYAASGKLSATAAASGDKVTLTVRLDNPGIIATRIFVRYDTKVLQLTGAENGSVFPKSGAVFGKDYSENPYTLLWDESLRRDNNTTSGTLCTLTFSVKGGTDSGKTTVRIEVDKASTFDVDLTDVPVADCSCSVDVPAVTTKGGASATTASDPTAAQKPSGGTTTTTKAAQPTTQKPIASATKITAAQGQTTAQKPTQTSASDPIAPATTAAGTSSAASTAAAGTTAGAAQSGETKPDAAAPESAAAALAAAENVTDSILTDGVLTDGMADDTQATVPEIAAEALTDDAQAPQANYRGLLWLLLLIPAAAAVILIVKKKKA